jgi:hypothetical protein
MPLERRFVYVFEFPFVTNVCMLTLSLLIDNNQNHRIRLEGGHLPGGRIGRPGVGHRKVYHFDPLTAL